MTKSSRQGSASPTVVPGNTNRHLPSTSKPTRQLRLSEFPFDKKKKKKEKSRGVVDGTKKLSARKPWRTDRKQVLVEKRNLSRIPGLTYYEFLSNLHKKHMWCRKITDLRDQMACLGSCRRFSSPNVSQLLSLCVNPIPPPPPPAFHTHGPSISHYSIQIIFPNKAKLETKDVTLLKIKY